MSLWLPPTACTFLTHFPCDNSCIYRTVHCIMALPSLFPFAACRETCTLKSSTWTRLRLGTHGSIVTSFFFFFFGISVIIKTPIFCNSVLYWITWLKTSTFPFKKIFLLPYFFSELSNRLLDQRCCACLGAQLRSVFPKGRALVFRKIHRRFRLRVMFQYWYTTSGAQLKAEFVQRLLCAETSGTAEIAVRVRKPQKRKWAKADRYLSLHLHHVACEITINVSFGVSETFLVGPVYRDPFFFPPKNKK